MTKETYTPIYSGAFFRMEIRKSNTATFVRIQNTAEAGGAWLLPKDMREMAAALVKLADEKDGGLKVAPAKKPRSYRALSPQAQKVYQHMTRAGSISMREAMADHQMAGGTLTRRIKDIEEAGFNVKRERSKHPLTRTLYTRYSLADSPAPSTVHQRGGCPSISRLSGWKRDSGSPAQN